MDAAVPAIRVENLTKYYGAVVGIEDLSFSVAPGEVYGFLGANGAGKTTTIRLLLDLLRPTRGRASVLGIDCHRDSLAARRRIGYLPGDLPVYPDLTARDYLAYLSRLDSRPVPADYLQQLLRRFDVSEIDQRRPLREQSHGMKQKIGIIQALMTRAPVLILDEPTAGLDPLMVQAFRETIVDLKQRGDTTVLLSSHVLAEVEQTCDRIGLVRGGRIVATGTLADLERDARRRVSVTFTAPVPPPRDADGIAVVSASPAEWTLDVRGPAGTLVAMLGGLPVRDLSIAPFKLEDYIAQFYKGAAR
ncbi:MAG TPA: ABC transporter ATP-binding protein [Vicinamibacterales bacterium]|nr:ABC transporter ATP-binding protein [Vicinamibacterales bacterium]